jgi:hypothetical protein
MEGIGIYHWEDGRKYEGYYRNDKKHRYGIYKFADGRIYAGYWYKGVQHGLGKYIVPRNDQVYYGLWEDGKRIEWLS